MLTKVLISLAAITVVLAAVVATQPSGFRVARSTLISAPPDRVFAHVNITDGPFAETREQLGGYFLVEATDLDEAISIAARIPMARKGTVEIRPVVEIKGLPSG